MQTIAIKTKCPKCRTLLRLHETPIAGDPVQCAACQSIFAFQLGPKSRRRDQAARKGLFARDPNRATMQWPVHAAKTIAARVTSRTIAGLLRWLGRVAEA